jgi:2-polyprenyl-6-methoxyphenol hydroxylase-like FAD-dependent oxidoreductase
VLIGDTAGHNDPIIGQGLSIALRDVHLVSEILRDAKTAGREPDFRPYVEERAERMRRFRITAQVVTTLRVDFGPEARERHGCTFRVKPLLNGVRPRHRKSAARA